MCCPYRGVAAEGGLWARLEAVGMSVEMTAGVLAARAMEGMQFGLGQTVVLSHHAIDHMVISSSFWPSMKQQVRWMKSTRFSRPKGHFGTALTFGLPFGLLAWGAAGLLGHPWFGQI